MYSGTVSWFNAREDKMFGFIELDFTREKYFFHINNGRVFEAAGQDSPMLSPKIMSRIPKKGDRVVFWPRSQVKGPTADPWGYEEEYMRVEREIAARPCYRARRQSKLEGQPWGEPTVLWLGNNLCHLIKLYPRKNDRSSDGLSPNYTSDDYSQKNWFERQNADGGWERCSDPRPSEHK